MNTMNRVECDLCPRRCQLMEGQLGFCKARALEDGNIVSLSYGKIIALSLDPIVKKPLSFFYPESFILSAGSFGCNMDCLFCQNYTLARSGLEDVRTYEMSPEELVQSAIDLKDRGNIGIAFTYNEPTINFEYVRDTFELARKENLETVLVSNGQINDSYLEVLLPLTTAWNIDLKTFSEENYKKLGGDFETTLNTITKAAKKSHLEITTLVVPGISDKIEDFKREVDFIADLDPQIPLHLSRYFPSHHYHEPPTSVSLLEEMKEIAENRLEHVILGNI